MTSMAGYIRQLTDRKRQQQKPEKSGHSTHDLWVEQVTELLRVFLLVSSTGYRDDKLKVKGQKSKK